jgi:uncharacterized protein
MTIEAKPNGERCNLSCSYCYQEPQRNAGNHGAGCDLEAIKSALEDRGGPFTLFGGEPLLLPFEQLDELVRWGTRKFGKVSIQTNATLITERHIELFRELEVGVGVSIDGPAQLNAARSTPIETLEIEKTIARLCEVGCIPSVIVTLSQHNGTADRRDRLAEWLDGLEAYGVKHARLHMLEIDSPAAAAIALTDDQTIELLLWLRGRGFAVLRIDLFDEIGRLLLDDGSSVSCTWNGCDALTTQAVDGIEGDGSSSNCGRTNKDGVGYLKAQKPGRERQLALYHVSQESGGCSGCRFFVVCKGGCPGTGIAGDWRNRSAQCRVIYALCEAIESDLLDSGRDPISLRDTLPEREAALLESCSAIGNTDHTDQHGDQHGDRPHGDQHGDSDHGDEVHRDHTDGAQ